jgi:hypothetical protein
MNKRCAQYRTCSNTHAEDGQIHATCGIQAPARMRVGMYPPPVHIICADPAEAPVSHMPPSHQACTVQAPSQVILGMWTRAWGAHTDYSCMAPCGQNGTRLIGTAAAGLPVSLAANTHTGTSRPPAYVGCTPHAASKQQGGPQRILASEPAGTFAAAAAAPTAAALATIGMVCCGAARCWDINISARLPCFAGSPCDPTGALPCCARGDGTQSIQVCRQHSSARGDTTSTVKSTRREHST